MSEQASAKTAVIEGFTPVPGGRIWYQVAGADKPGLPLVTIHGGPGASSDYLEPLAALADERPVVFFDQLDCGRSERTGNPALWTVERSCAELRELRRALGFSRIHLLGQSWGAALAVDYALGLDREAAASLILSGPMLSAGRWAADQRGYLAELPAECRKVIKEAEASGDFTSPAYQEAVMVYYRRHVCRLPEWPECLNRTFAAVNAELYLTMWGPSEFTVTGTLKEFDRTRRLGELALPVLLTCGAYDEATPESTRFFQRLIPDAEMRIFNDASHEHHLENPTAYLDAVRRFLNRIERS